MKRKVFATTAALVGLFSAQVAIAQTAAEACVTQEDLADAVVFTMPIAYSAFSEKCSKQLDSGGFVAREGDGFIAAYAALQTQAWPGAYSLFKTFAAKGEENGGASEMATLFDSLPAELLQPFFEVIIEAELAKNIKVADCSKIERIIEPLAPLPPENLGILIATIFDIIPDIDNPKVCPSKDK